MRRLWPVVLLAGCGYVGDPLPPALRIPKAVTDLSARQIGPEIEVRFTLPELTTEGLPVQPGTVDLRIGENPAPPFSAEAWLGRAKGLEAKWPNPPARAVVQRIPAGDWADQDVVLGVRLTSPKGRASGLSNLVSLRVVPSLRPPGNLTAAATAEGIRLHWTAREGEKYRILRGKEAVREVAQSEYLDQFIDFGKQYSYQLVTLVETGDTRAESLPSVSVVVDYQDRFAPGVPTGLTAIAGAASVEIAWDRNTESDLAGYRVYRADGDGEFRPIGELVNLPAYSDRTAAKGTRYRYFVTAVDRTGNESPRQPEPAVADLP